MPITQQFTFIISVISETSNAAFALVIFQYPLDICH
jgi:hypothetical protein